jgi:hypothetical protein
MLLAIVEVVILEVPRLIGWAALKTVTIGRYRGLREEDQILEGAVGLAVVGLLCVVAYTTWSR